MTPCPPMKFKCQLRYFNYPPQQRCGKGYVFTRVCDSVQEGSASVHAGIPPPLPRRSLCQGDPPAQETPRQGDPLPRRTPTKKTPLPRRTPPLPRRPPPPTKETPREADSGIRSINGRYASYWNAFLLCTIFITINDHSFGCPIIYTDRNFFHRHLQQCLIQ